VSDAGSVLHGGSPTGAAAMTRKRRVRRIVRQHAGELRMQGFVDLLQHGRHDRVDARGARDLIGDAPQQPLRVVAVAEEPAIELRQPPVAPRAHDQQRRHQERKPPPARLHDRRERLVAVHDDVHQQHGAQDRAERVEEPARQRILQPLAHDQADVEQAVPQDGVGERRRKREEHQRQHGQRPRREDVGAGIEPVAEHDTGAGDAADHGPRLRTPMRRRTVGVSAARRCTTSSARASAA
jgi:hypothetical protein